MSYGGGGSSSGPVLSTTLVGASVAAGGAEISHATETWCKAGMYGYCIGPLNGAPANAVRPGQWRCAADGTCILSWHNGTAGALTPASASGANPYLFVPMVY
jgi:hypothetical protein